MSYLENYMHYASGNEAPEIFHKWAAISALSATIGRRVFVTQGHWQRHCNLYVILVGDPANGKSTAMNISKKLIMSLPSIPVMASSITKERLTQLLSNEDTTKASCRIVTSRFGRPYEFSQATLYANELVTLLGTNSMAMIDFFTDVWDEDEFVVETKNKGTDRIPNPFVTLLGCMTPQVTSSLLKQNIISGGFSRRCIFVFNNKRGRPVPRPIVTDAQKAARTVCLSRLNELLKVRGEFQWAQGATEMFDEWYNYNSRLIGKSVDIVMQGYYRSKDELVLKLAMLLQLSDNDELLLTPEKIQEALGILSDTESGLSRVFAGTGDNHQAKMAEKILIHLESTDEPMLEKQIYRELFSDGSRLEIEQVLHHLVQTDRIVKGTKGGASVISLYPTSI
jgi:hypothetical protein